MLMNSRDQSGLSLMELLLSLSIVIIVIVAIIQFFSTNLLQNTQEYKKSKIYYRAVKEMEALIAKDYSSPELLTLYNAGSNIRFIDDGKFLFKVTVESIDPLTGLLSDPYPTDISEDRLLKKLTVSAVLVEDSQNPQKARQVDLVRFISP